MPTETTTKLLPQSIVFNGSLTGNEVLDPENLLSANTKTMKPASLGGSSDVTIGNYPFSLPQGALVTGIKMTLLAKNQGSTVPVTNVVAGLVVSNGVDYDIYSKSALPVTTDVLEEYVLGGISDLWGKTSWSADEINNLQSGLTIEGVEIAWAVLEVFFTPNSDPLPPDPIEPGCVNCNSTIQALPFELVRVFRSTDTKLLLRSFNLPDGRPITLDMLGECGGEITMTIDPDIAYRNGANFIENIVIRTEDATITNQPNGYVEIDLGDIENRGIDFIDPYTYRAELVSEHAVGATAIITNNGRYESLRLQKCHIGVLVSAPIIVADNNGVVTPSLKKVTFSDNLSVTVPDPLKPNEVVVTAIGAGHVIQTYETSMPQQSRLNFKKYFDLLNNAGNLSTDVDMDLDGLANDEDFITYLTENADFRSAVNNFITPGDSVGSFGKVAQKPLGVGSTYYQIFGDIDGVNKTFVLSTNRYVLGKILVKLNGVDLKEGVGAQWTASNANIGEFTFLNAPIPGDVITVHFSDIAGETDAGVQLVTGNIVDNTDAENPIINLYWDGVTITGLGTIGSPLVASGTPQVNSDWNAVSGVAQILNKPTIPDVSTKADKVTDIAAGTGLTGGGNLSTDRTIALNGSSIASLVKADTALQQSDLDALTTDDVPEGATNKYFTEPRVRGTVLTGFTPTGGTVTAADSVLTAMQKLQSQINTATSGLTYKGSWDADTNTPTLVSGVGTAGFYYIVSVDGTTTLDGISTWNQGDWAIFNGTTWQKIDNTSDVVSVNGKIGVVVLDKTDVGLSNVDNTSDINKPISTLTQTAINGKQNTITGAITTVTTVDLATNRVVVSNASGKVAVSTVTTTLLDYLLGLTGNIQTQLDLKATLASLSTVATTGAYSDLTGTPTIPAAQVNADWNAVSGVAQILNKPTIPNFSTKADKSTLVSAGTGLTGGGDLSADRTLALSAGTIASLASANTALQVETDPTVPAHVKAITTGNITSWNGKGDVFATGTQTITNKRNVPRVSTTASGTISPDISLYSYYQRTAQSGSLTINSVTGTPLIGEVVVFEIYSAATIGITWNATYIPYRSALPTTKVGGKRLLVTAQYNGTNWMTLTALQQ